MDNRMKSVIQSWRLSVIVIGLAAYYVPCNELVAGRIDPATFTIYNFSGGMAGNMPGDIVEPPTGLHVVATSQTTNSGVVSGSGMAVAGSLSPAPIALTNLTDNNLQTFVTLSNPAVLLIDLGQTAVVDRVYLIGTTNRFGLWPNWQQNQTNPPLGLVVAYVGNTTTNTNRVAEFTVPYDAGNPVDTEVDLRFSPAAGRYVRLELQTQVTWGINATNNWPGPSFSFPMSSLPPATNVSWNVGEVDLYGFTGAGARQTNLNAVVLPAGAAAPLALAASELSYYLGELTGSPHPIIAPAGTNQYTGILYTIVDLKSLAPNYSAMMSNIASGLLPTNLSVTTQGNQVMFSGWPYRCVLWGVWEFLERQGVRWLYPDARGDFVPTGNGVNLSQLPLHYIPSATSIYANWDTDSLQPWPGYITQSIRQGYLYPWRNRWNSSWNTDVIGGAEIPTLPSPGITVNSNYTEGFAGYPHNFSNVVPNRVLQLNQYTKWWGWATTNAGSEVNPSTSGAPVCTMDDPTLISWVAGKMANIAAAQPLACTWPLNLAHFRQPFNLLPLDASIYSQDPSTIASNGPAAPNPVPWVKEYDTSYSGMYYSFVTAVANRVQQLSPSSVPLVGALAYADLFAPPTNIPALAKFPTNVQVEVCLYGAPNLFMSAPANSGLEAALKGWQATSSRLASYDYALLHTDYWQTNPVMPVPLVAATVDRANYLAAVGALNGGCQATTTSFPYNPWNFYAYPRIRWNTNQTAAQLEQEFFDGFYGEAAAPMLAYYQAMENYHVRNNVDLHYMGYCYSVTPGSFPLDVLAAMGANLNTAERLATNWWIADRVAHSREGYNWVVSALGLTGTNLTDASVYPQLTLSNGTHTVNLAQMKAVPANKPFGNYVSLQGTNQWFFGAQGEIQMPLEFVQSGTYNVSIVARSIPSQGVWPVMNVFLGPSNGSVRVNSLTNSTYSFALPVASGFRNLVITYNNAASGGARNLIVSQIQIAPQ
jgi:hypothetical protein